jgi:cyclopropane fatty-acyl-phospholipid synthase-like methyltransferase
MNADMRTIVQAGYEKDDYVRVFRANPNPTPFEIRFLDLLDPYLSSEASILDLGSGTGLPYDKYLVEKGYRLSGVDFSSKHLALARQNVPQATYLHGDFSKIVFAPSAFDAIVSFYAIFHLPRQEHPTLFARMYQWLKPQGVLLVTLGTSDMEYGEETDWVGAPMVWSSYAPEVYRQMLVKQGFRLRISDFEGAPGDEEYHFWLLAQKE